MGRTWHGGLLFQSEDYGEVAAMRFSLLAQPPPSKNSFPAVQPQLSLNGILHHEGLARGCPVATDNGFPLRSVNVWRFSLQYVDSASGDSVGSTYLSPQAFEP